MRKVSVGTLPGLDAPRVLLNNKFLFWMGMLDQVCSQLPTPITLAVRLLANAFAHSGPDLRKSHSSESEHSVSRMCNQECLVVNRDKKPKKQDFSLKIEKRRFFLPTKFGAGCCNLADAFNHLPL